MTSSVRPRRIAAEALERDRARSGRPELSSLRRSLLGELAGLLGTPGRERGPVALMSLPGFVESGFPVATLFRLRYTLACGSRGSWSAGLEGALRADLGVHDALAARYLGLYPRSPRGLPRHWIELSPRGRPGERSSFPWLPGVTTLTLEGRVMRRNSSSSGAYWSQTSEVGTFDAPGRHAVVESWDPRSEAERRPSDVVERESRPDVVDALAFASRPPPLLFVPCSGCAATGRVPDYSRPATPDYRPTLFCPRCRGSGVVIGG